MLLSKNYSDCFISYHIKLLETEFSLRTITLSRITLLELMFLSKNNFNNFIGTFLFILLDYLNNFH